MDAIILEGRKSTRMQPLTDTTPKHLLELQGRPLLEWSLLSLRGIVDRVLVIANDMPDQVEAYMSQQRIISQYRLVAQHPEPLGDGHALQCCQPYLKQPEFFVIKSDCLYDRLSLEKLAAQPLGILGAMRDDPAPYAVLKTNETNKLIYIQESPMLNAPPQVLVNAKAYKLDTRIFGYPIRRSHRDEYEIGDYVMYLVDDKNDVQVVEAQFWFPIGNPDHLMQAQSLDLNVWIPH